MNKYYALTTSGRTADIYIFGDITSWEWLESDVSSYTLSKELQGLDVDVINVHINSYGGEVAEGLAIYNTLKNHKAKVETICDGFACSAAAVIFMAGDTRVMNPASLLMIHNVWTSTAGDANELRKTADDLDIITQATMEAFKAHVNISDDELKALLDAESWLSPQEALDKGFATSIKAVENSENPSQSVRNKVVERLLKPSNSVSLDDVIEKLNAALAKSTAPNAEPQTPQQEQEQPQKPKENKFINLLNALAKC
jgi:ATP-dependent Clp protease protease subunit